MESKFKLKEIFKVKEIDPFIKLFLENNCGEETCGGDG